MNTLGMDDFDIEQTAKEGEKTPAELLKAREQTWFQKMAGHSSTGVAHNLGNDKALTSFLKSPFVRNGERYVVIGHKPKGCKAFEVKVPIVYNRRDDASDYEPKPTVEKEFSLHEQCVKEFLSGVDKDTLDKYREHIAHSFAVYESGLLVAQKKQEELDKYEAMFQGMSKKQRKRAEAAYLAAKAAAEAAGSDSDEEEEGTKVEEPVEKPGLLKRVAEAAGNIAGVVADANKRPMLGN
ncbi:hypothetical protein CYMTET_26586 [Cymbomonas tetramitiformis]|uniref:Uncharacterized protein n=1 Tax=Cymbomonas tetramitiformis TaxID=36881 RepID=A0AAE0FRK4_9CHLO|nr:hypothetical protein CYMTET_37957 [Cymbomonas tetramitiformis]KAK3264689.1 hypothetical protein CYMTET_26586 [Cymbomonas tetramitiformis]